MKYQRKIFYINEYVDGMCGKNIGYFKLFQRGNRVQIEMHTEGNYDFLGHKIYLLEKDKHAVNKLYFGSIIAKNGDVIMQRNTGESEHENCQIIGVIVEGKSQFVCGGTDDAQVCISDYFSEERKPEFSAAEMREEELQEDQEEQNREEEEEEEIIQVELEVAHDQAYEYRKILETRPNMYPFEDDEMTACVQLSPADFSDFPKEYWKLGSNTFLLQGYYHYRHLILSETKDMLYIGIPGQYHRRDKYLADMFGFQRFKGIRKREIQLGDFGYWLMPIQKPQPTEKWVDCGENCDIY